MRKRKLWEIKITNRKNDNNDPKIALPIRNVIEECKNGTIILPFTFIQKNGIKLAYKEYLNNNPTIKLLQKNLYTLADINESYSFLDYFNLNNPIIYFIRQSHFFLEILFKPLSLHENKVLGY